MVTIEICCDGFESAALSAQAGASRIELCSALEVGGLTPTIATLTRIKQHFPTLPVMAMLRNRAGGFCYSDADFTTLQQDAEHLLAAGADGLVFGCLTADFQFDVPRIAALTELAQANKRQAVIHRAFDNTQDPFVAMQTLIDLGVTRVLTSGQAATVIEGMDLIAELQQRYGEHIEILAGAGVTPENARRLVEKTGVRQLHASCKTYYQDPTTVGKVDYSVRQTPTPFSLQCVDADAVRALVRL